MKWYVDQAAAKTYEELKANHVSDYQKIFDRVDLNLGQTVSTKPTDEFFLHTKQELQQMLKDVSWKLCYSSMEDL